MYKNGRKICGSGNESVWIWIFDGACSLPSETRNTKALIVTDASINKLGF